MKFGASLRWCLIQEEAARRAKEEQERREEEEYLKLKASFVIEDQGEEEQLTEDQVRPLHLHVTSDLSEYILLQGSWKSWKGHGIGFGSLV